MSGKCYKLDATWAGTHCSCPQASSRSPRAVCPVFALCGLPNTPFLAHLVLVQEDLQLVLVVVLVVVLVQEDLHLVLVQVTLLTSLLTSCWCRRTCSWQQHRRCCLPAPSAQPRLSVWCNSGASRYCLPWSLSRLLQVTIVRRQDNSVNS